MPPAQECLCEALREEAQLPEEADGTSAKALARWPGVMDREVIELASEVAPPFQDQGMEVRVEPKRVVKGW
jgi:hypothetical protein